MRGDSVSQSSHRSASRRLPNSGFWVDDVAATRKAIEAAGGRHWMGEVEDGGGFYEVKFHDPNGVVVDLTANGWSGASKDVGSAVEEPEA